MNNVPSPRSESNRLRRAPRGLLGPVDVVVASTQQVDQYRDTVGLLYQAALAEGKVVYERPNAG